MDVVYTRCCGLDIHKKNVVACFIISEPGQKLAKETRTFRTMTADLLKLADWLYEADCIHVAMERTGQYWRPIYNLLEGRFELLLINAHGLLRGSFVPPWPQRQLRDLTRYPRGS